MHLFEKVLPKTEEYCKACESVDFRILFGNGQVDVNEAEILITIKIR